MGHYGTTLRTVDGTIYIDSITNAKSEYQIEEKINDTNENINKIKSRLLQLATCTPKDVFTSDEDGDVLSKLNSEFESNWEWLEEEMVDNVEAHFAQKIIDDWKYSNKNAKFDELISPQEKYADTSLSLQEIEDKEKDKSIDDILNRAKNSLSMNSYNDRYKINEKYAAYFNNELYVDLYGEWMFDTAEEAHNKVKSAINTNAPWAINKEYVTENKEFILSLIPLIDWNVLNKDKEKYNSFYEPVTNADEYKALVDMIINGKPVKTDLIRLSSTMENAYSNIIDSHIEIRRII